MVVKLVARLILVECAGCGESATFSGRVGHGQNFSRRLSGNLWFCLFAEPDANGGGWRIAVETRCAEQGDDFVAVATPPMHGPNPREIAGWHFEPGANAPQRVRGFAFVVNDSDWHRLMTDLNSYTDAEKNAS